MAMICFHSKDVVVIVDIVSLKIVDSKMLFMPRIFFYAFLIVLMLLSYKFLFRPRMPLRMLLLFSYNFFQAQDVLEDVIVIVAVVHINKEFFFGFIILFTFQAQDALEEEERRTFRKEQRTNILQGQVGIPLCYISFY